jgi:hypothetical protein
MRYVRLYADAKGESRFVQVPEKFDETDHRPPAPPIFVSHAFEAEALQFVRVPAGWVGENICPPERQFFFCLQGQLEIRAGDGEKRTLHPGDVMLMDDASAKGHSSRVTGAKDLIAAIVSIEQR